MLPQNPNDLMEASSEYDEFTGFVEPEKQIEQDLKDSEAIVEDGNLFRSLTAHPAWKILEEFSNNEIKSLHGALVQATELKRIRKLQAMIEALNLLPLIVDKVLSDSDKAAELINDYLKSEPKLG